MKKRDKVHVWDVQELSFRAEHDYENPYMDVDIWIDLEGPDFSRRIYGFWDGGSIFCVRFVCTAPGIWKWKSGSNQDDAGLNGCEGSIAAEAWSEADKRENPCRRGMIRPSSGGRAFEYADGTPFYFLGDTWWAASTDRYPWYDDEDDHPAGLEMGFKDMVRYRRRQGFNGIAMIASFPTWADDGYPSLLVLDDGEKTTVRSAWQIDGKSSADGNRNRPAKDMVNEGGRPFLFPGKVPDYEEIVPDFERINPDYFRHMDKKIRYLNDNGMTACIEAARRDVSQVWKNYYAWPDSYARYIQYIFFRYHAFNTFLSPIHFDYAKQSIPAKEYNIPANLTVERYGMLPYGNPVSTNAGPSTLLNFGGIGRNKAEWLTYHQIGNWREHVHYWHLTEIFHSEPAVPAMNGEPYYPGFPDNDPPADSREAERNCRSGMYGSFLSGGLGGYIYGVQGMWGADRHDEADWKMWEALEFRSGSQVRHLGKFVMSAGKRYRDLIPNHELLVPSRSGEPYGYTGWAYCGYTSGKALLMCYFEEGCPRAALRSLNPESRYVCSWYDPRSGMWTSADGKASADVRFADQMQFELVTDEIGWVNLPEFPDDGDWALILEQKGTDQKG